MYPLNLLRHMIFSHVTQPSQYAANKKFRFFMLCLVSQFLPQMT